MCWSTRISRTSLRNRPSTHAGLPDWRRDPNPSPFPSLSCPGSFASPPILDIRPASTLETAFAFVSSLVERPTARIVGPGPDHLEIFERLCRKSGATGKLVADAQHAAIAVEHGCTMVSTDSDFNRFTEVRWHHPLRPDGT